MTNFKTSEKKQIAIILERLSSAGSEIKGIGNFILLILLCAVIFSFMIYDNLSTWNTLNSNRGGISEVTSHAKPMNLEQVTNLIYIYWFVSLVIVLIIASKFYWAGDALTYISDYFQNEHGNVNQTESDPTVYKVSNGE